MIIAATGHRPQKLTTNTDLAYSTELQSRLESLATVALQKYQPDSVLSGMSLGFDTALAIAAINLSIPVTAVIPFKGQELKWPIELQIQYHDILLLCTNTVIVCTGEYSKASMFTRNRWLVDNCDLLLALWNGSENSGTAFTVRYAKEVKRPIANLWGSWVKYAGVQLLNLG